MLKKEFDKKYKTVTCEHLFELFLNSGIAKLLLLDVPDGHELVSHVVEEVRGEGILLPQLGLKKQVYPSLGECRRTDRVIVLVLADRFPLQV